MKALPQAIAGRELPQRDHGREVERRDAGDDAERLAHASRCRCRGRRLRCTRPSSGAGCRRRTRPPRARAGCRPWRRRWSCRARGRGSSASLSYVAVRRARGTSSARGRGAAGWWRPRPAARPWRSRRPRRTSALEASGNLGAHLAGHRLEDVGRSGRDVPLTVLAADEMPVLDHGRYSRKPRFPLLDALACSRQARQAPGRPVQGPAATPLHAKAPKAGRLAAVLRLGQVGR